MNEYMAKKFAGDVPWNCDDPEKLGTVISDFVENYDDFLTPWTRTWFDNFNFIHGNHNYVWSQKWGFAVDTDTISTRFNKSISMRSKTNVSRTVFESLSSLIFGNAPDWDVLAADESSSQGRRFQKIIEKTLDYYYERLAMDKELRTFTNNLVTYGLAAAKVDWSVNAGHMIETPLLEEQDVSLFTGYPQTLDSIGIVDTIIADNNNNGEPLTEKRLVPKRGLNGEVMTESKWSGDVRVTTLTPFEYRRELNPHGAHKCKWYQHIRIIDYDDFLDEYGEMDGRTKYFDKIRPGVLSNSLYKFAIRQFLRMNFITPMSSGDMRRRTFSALKEEFLKNKVIVIEHYDRPHPTKFNKGRMCAVVNGYVTNITRPQYSTNRVNGWHPFVEAGWITLSPSAIPSGPMNDITEKNRELDTLDSLIDTSSLRNLGSMMLIKAGSGLDAQKLKAEPGMIEEVNDLDSVRYVRDQLPIPPIATQLRDMKKDDIYEISGAQDAIRGDRSKGISSGYGQKIIEEREQRRLTPVRRELERATAEIGQKIIACQRACAATLGEHMFGFLKRSAAGQFSEKDILAYLKTPITFGVDVNVRAGSMVAKSNAAQQQDIMDMIEKTPAGQRLQDAGVLDNVLKKFGVEVLRDKSSVHRDKAARENEVFWDLGTLGPDATGVQIPVVCDMDDHELHIQAHEIDYVEKFDDIQHDEFQLTLRMMHIDMHKIYQRENVGELPQGTAYNFKQIYDQAKALPPRNLGQIQELQKQAEQIKLQNKAQAQQGQPGGQPNQEASQTQGGQQAEKKDEQAQGQVGREMGGA